MKLMGGKINNNSSYYLLLLFLVFFIKAYLVKVSYNYIFPKLSYNLGYTGKFIELNYYESMIVVILFSNLI